MSSNKIRQILYGAVCLLLVGCASTPATDMPPTSPIETIASPAPADTSESAQAPPMPPTPTLAPMPTSVPPAFQFQCGSNIQEIAYSPDGTLLAALGQQRITICDMSTLSPRVTLETESEITGGIDWSPDSTKLAAGLSDGTVWVWYVTTGEQQLVFDTDGETVLGVNWSPDNRDGLLVVSRQDYDIHIWDTSTEKKSSIELSFAGFETVWSPDGKQFAVGCACDRTYIWSAATGKSLLYFKAPAPAYNGMAWSPDGTRFVGEFGTTVVYDAKTAEELFAIDASIMAWSGDGKWLAGVSSGDIHAWLASTGEDMTIIGSANRVVSLAWSPDGNYLASETQDGLVSLWNLQDLTPSPRPAPPKATLNEKGPWYVFTGSSILSGSRYLWAVNAIDGTGLTKLAHEPVLDFAVRPTDSGENSATIAYVTHSQTSGESTLGMVALPDTETETITSSGGSLAWSPDGHKLAYDRSENDSSSSVYVYDIDTQNTNRAAIGEGNVLDIRWSPDGRYIVYERYAVSGMGGPILSGIWAARVDGGREISLFADDAQFIDYQWFKGWLNPVEILLGDSDDGGIRAVNIETGEAASIYEGDFVEAIFAKEHNTWLLTGAYSPEPDTPLVLIHDGKESEVAGKGIARIWWSAAHNLFLGLTEQGDLYSISPVGEVTKTPVSANYLYEYIVVESPDDTLWAWRPYYADTDEPIRIGEAISPPQWKVPTASDITWSSDSRHLMLLCADGVWVAERPDFKPVQIVKDVYAAYDYWNWLPWEGEWIP